MNFLNFVFKLPALDLSFLVRQTFCYEVKAMIKIINSKYLQQYFAADITLNLFILFIVDQLQVVT